MTVTWLDIQRKQFSKSKARWTAVLVLHGVALGLGLLATWVQSLSGWTGIGLLLVYAALLIVENAARYRDGLANRIRQLMLLSDSLGVAVRPLEAATLETETGMNVTETVLTAPGYFDSGLPQGSRRLAENVAQSAFYTARLFKDMALLLLSILLTSVGVLIIVMLGMAELGTAGWTTVAGRTTATVMTLILSTGALQVYRGYAQQADRCMDISRNALQLSGQDDPQLVDVVIEMMNYQAGVGELPPVADFVWARRRTQLNAAWKNHCASCVSG